jgi:hypothetical protein
MKDRQVRPHIRRPQALSNGRGTDPLHCVRLPLLKAGVAERSGTTEGLSSGLRLDADRGQCVAPIRKPGHPLHEKERQRVGEDERSEHA